MTSPILSRRNALRLCGCAAAGALAARVSTPKTAHAQSDLVSRVLGGLTWIKQSGFRIQNGEQVIYIDPYQVPNSPRDGDLVLITHPHNDHCEAASVLKVAKNGAAIAGEEDSVAKLGAGVSNKTVIRLGDEMTIGDLHVSTVPAYNLNKSYHPRTNEWLGFILTLKDGRVFYHAGDTDFIPEMNGLQPDAAFLPAGGTYTMDAQEAVQAAKAMNPKIAVLMHYFSASDATRFEQGLAGSVPVLVMANGQSIPPSETAIEHWTES
ncbi:MAG: MBL fold metallo-hydrolase [bacterium]|nr:MBL fold metallo-hydrolase [bacterium]